MAKSNFRQIGRDRRRTPGAYRDPIAFVAHEDARHALTGNPNRAKLGAAQLDRDSATAKRDGAATQGARLARTQPLGSRRIAKFEARIPSLGEIRP